MVTHRVDEHGTDPVDAGLCVTIINIVFTEGLKHACICYRSIWVDRFRRRA